MGTRHLGTPSIQHQPKRRIRAQRAVRVVLTLLLALSLFPARAFSAFANEPVSSGTESTEQGASPDTLAPLSLANSELETQAGELAEIVLEAEEAGILIINNKWSEDITIYQDGKPSVTLTEAGTATFTVNSGETITVEEAAEGTFRSWALRATPFVNNVACKITSMPEMSAFTTDALGTEAGDYFFGAFNRMGSLTSLPADSFDTSDITTAGNDFFAYFNNAGPLISLPAESFDTSNITMVGDSFFSSFNYAGSLTSLPAGSFGTSGITTAGDTFFSAFNNMGSLTSLPAGSFGTSGITTAGSDFFSFFNINGSLTSLPTGSFDTSSIATAGSDFFNAFDWEGQIECLPSSFQLPEDPDAVGTNYCSYMFYNSALTKGNEAVSLYFDANASEAFFGTNISPESPAAGEAVQVNGFKSIAQATIAPIADQTHTGSALEPELEVTLAGTTLVKGTDYTATYSDNIDIGTATVTITGIGNYDEDASATFTIISAYTYRTLTDTATGISLAGWFTRDASLVIAEKTLHAQGSCVACDEIRSKGNWLLLYDISLTGSHQGNVELSLPVPSNYNGQNMEIWHCKGGSIEKVTLTASNGFLKGSFSTLSPFAVFVPTQAAIPQTGDSNALLIFLGVLLPVLALSGLIAGRSLKRRRRAAM